MQKSGRQKVRSRSQVVRKDWEGFPEGLGRTSAAPGGQGVGLRIRPQICHREEQAGTPHAEVWAKRKGVEVWPWTSGRMSQSRLSGRGEGWCPFQTCSPEMWDQSLSRQGGRHLASES